MINSKRGSAGLWILIILIILVIGIGAYFLLFKGETLRPSCPEGNTIAPNPLKCRDSDFGSGVINGLGIVTNKIDKKTDSCLNDKVLREYSCDCITGEINYIDFDCSQNNFNSCREGICIK